MSTALQVTEQTRLEEIASLHGELVGMARQALPMAIRIGQLLHEQKEALLHGQFAAWIAAHLPFTPRTARNYMKVFEHRERLKTESVSVLTDAYRLLAPVPAPEMQCRLIPKLLATNKSGNKLRGDALKVNTVFTHGHITRQMRLMHSTKGTQEIACPGPHALGGIDVDLTNAIPVVIAGPFVGTTASAPVHSYAQSYRRSAVDHYHRCRARAACWRGVAADRLDRGAFRLFSPAF
ncbi:MAG: DUF3102 domain-containing protein [Candidatus Latescibacteria bacterium]|nr:DUF3102 domain-containing protein [Candidatus Latescibacterota bacterium]